ncbi:NifB/NifX family molybdenum-iron cluster-binding protein [Telmatospirillum sp.]|uniref:NifB/NifX family molybdenum-iron cluster-binding protein n=1 Tax=Telmatospirillum sp. TaxID=2079197 RepID=UPI0028516F7B|nr:NifB/NifX family molybdenum-iron cluster-binding protein [Telmatospirillum sp.]MDR3437280.1 NifB/NifX family molybdenum-iron cluster-binding protein [Telmatospirillum sp.]
MIKVAVPSRGNLVDQHFGHCESFTIFTVDDQKDISEDSRLTPPPDCGCKSDVVTTLVDMGVTVLIAGGMGQGAVAYLNESGIRVIRGASGPVLEAVRAWLDGRLHDNDEVCHAHGEAGCPGH